MIVDLNQSLYVVDERAATHLIKSIDLINKTVLCTDDNVYEYATTDITVVAGNYTE